MTSTANPKSINRHEFLVKPPQNSMRIDLFLASMLPELSRRKVRQILDVGGCYVNNKRMHIASRQVRTGDKVRVEFSLEGLQKSRQKKFVLSDSDILFENQNLIAINKPPGLPSQATRDQDVMHAETSLRDWLKSKNRVVDQLILLHRLDKETSGVLLFATNPKTATWITDQFRERLMRKTYWAIAKGIPKNNKFEVTCYLSEIDKKTGIVSPVHSGGKASKTTFELRQSNQSAQVSWIVCYPETGRSHQIRVHLHMIGHPIVGDKRYGKAIATASINIGTIGEKSDELNSLAAIHHQLHARSITFSPAPQDPPVTIEAEPPPTFQTILAACFFPSDQNN